MFFKEHYYLARTMVENTRQNRVDHNPRKNSKGIWREKPTD